MLEEAAGAGIEGLCVVVGPGDETAYAAAIEALWHWPGRLSGASAFVRSFNSIPGRLGEPSLPPITCSRAQPRPARTF